MSKLVIVIDDSASMLTVMKHMIESFHHICILFRHPDEALRTIPHTKPDLIICDYMMFDMDGLQVINTLRGLGVHCQMILYSALYDPDVPEKCLLDGISFFPKPIKNETLKLILDKL